MMNFTKEERFVLITLAGVLWISSVLRFSLKKYPQLHDIVNFIDTEKVYAKVDVNTASLEELINIPYIGPYTAERIIEYRQEKGPFTSLEEIKSVKGVKEKNFKKFSAYLRLSLEEKFKQ